MSLLPPVSRGRVSGLVRSTLTDRVAVLAPGVGGTDALGYATGGEPVTAGTFAASVTPESTDERRARERSESVTGYRVRFEQTATTARITGGYALRWERPASRGGALTLNVEGDPLESASGQFVDVVATHTAATREAQA